MKTIKRIIGVFTGIMCLAEISLAFTQKQQFAVFIVIAIIFGIITFLLFKPTTNDRKKDKIKQDKRHEQLSTCTASHVNGLPLAENATCVIKSLSDKFLFSSGSATFDLEKNKITDMCIKTDTEIQQQYVSSMGGAVGGALLFGPVGAIIGGRAKKKTVSHKTKNYLIITYESNGEIKYIGFDVSFCIASARMFVNEYNSTADKNNLNISL